MKKVTYKIKLTLPDIEGDLVKWSAYEDDVFIGSGEEGWPELAFRTAVEQTFYNAGDL